MKHLLLILLIVFALGVVALLPSRSEAGWHYSPTYRTGYTYYSSCSGYSAGYYYYSAAPAYYYPTPSYTTSYNPDSAKQLEILDKAMSVLSRMAEANFNSNGNGGNAPNPNGPPGPLRATGLLRDGPTIITQRCASCHAADRVEQKGSKLVLTTAAGKVADIAPADKRNMVKRVYEIDPSKCMPPSKPLAEEERAALAEFLGIQVIRGGQ